MNILEAAGFIAIPITLVTILMALRARQNVNDVMKGTSVQLHLPQDDHHHDDKVGHLI